MVRCTGRRTGESRYRDDSGATPESGGRCGTRRPPVDRYESGSPSEFADERRRVDVPFALAKPEVEPHAGGTDRRPGHDGVTGMQRRRHEPSVGRTPPVGVADDDEPCAGDRPGPRHGAGCDRGTTAKEPTRYSSPRLPAQYGQGGSRNGSVTTPLTGGRQQGAAATRAGTLSASTSTRADTDETRRDMGPPDDTDAGRTQLRRRRRQVTPAALIRERRCSTDLVWICDTRLSVTPMTSPISESVRPSS